MNTNLINEDSESIESDNETYDETESEELIIPNNKVRKPSVEVEL
jgi:hypothetical protein